MRRQQVLSHPSSKSPFFALASTSRRQKGAALWVITLEVIGASEDQTRVFLTQLDLVSLTGYKYVGMVLCATVGLFFGSKGYYVVRLCIYA